MSISVQHTRFEQQYLSLRKKEGRLYTDEELRQLPFVPSRHPLKREWTIRDESCWRLVEYLSAKRKALDILEIGCGNGWFCNKLSAIADASVTGIDINETELQQARRVFPGIQFIYGDMGNGLIEARFDIIVFAASFQYFSSAKKILETCLTYLKTNGEIHILDTHFYTEEESVNATKRSFNYFASAGFPAMQEFYFHHTVDELKNFNYDILYNPKNKFNRLFKKNPFPWIRIKQ